MVPGGRLGGGEGRSINVASLIIELKVLAGLLQQFGAPLTGVIIGSCELGRNDIDWAVAMQGTSLRWIVGYRHSVEWFRLHTSRSCATAFRAAERGHHDYRWEMANAERFPVCAVAV
jgi:hypothetical protein